MLSEDDIIMTDKYMTARVPYVKTDFFYTHQQLKWRGRLHPSLPISSVIIAGHSDLPITDAIVDTYHLKCVFCVNNKSTKSSVYGLPLGITNDCDDSPFHRIYGNTRIMIDTIKIPRQVKYFVLMNFSVDTYPVERKRVYDMFKDKEWIVSTPIENTLKGRKRFLEDIRNSEFVLCPRGNGIDTHRLWETLYMGSIPIVIYDETVHKLFTDLPILFIREWGEVTYEFLIQKREEMLSKTWNLEKLKIRYWLDFIREKASVLS